MNKSSLKLKNETTKKTNTIAKEANPIFINESFVTQVVRNVDVVVAGGGPAGFSTAVNAARMGAKVILLEQSGTVGGMATAGLMNHWTGLTEGPFYEELLDRCKDSDKSWNYYADKVLDGKRIINPEKTKTVMLEMLEEAGVELLLYTFVSSPILKDGKIRGVITESKNGREAILGKVVVDCTGDGDIAARAGAEYVMGREDDGKMQPVTIMCKVGGVDYDRAIFPGEFDDNIELSNGNIQDLGKKHLDHPTGHVLLYPTFMKGVVSVNMSNCLNIDGTKTSELTKAEIECRKQMKTIVDFLGEHIPGFENAFQISSASLIGVRETRHFKGLYTVTEDDIRKATVFGDWVATRLHFTFDIHNVEGCGLDKRGDQSDFNNQSRYSLPYRAFVPEKLDGLLLCGRNISGTHVAHSNYRVMPICVNMGQGIGIAAAICAKKNILPRHLEVSEVQDELKKQGVTI